MSVNLGPAADVCEALLGWRPARLVRLAGGYSSAVFRAHPPDGAEPVIVRFPGSGADAVTREALLAERLGGRVPVAGVLGTDAAGAVSGRPSLVTTHLPGDPASDVLDGGAAGDGYALGRALAETLARVGDLRFERGGLLDARLEPTGEAFFRDTPAEMLGLLGGMLGPGGAAREALGAVLAERWLRRIAEAAPALAVVDGARRLVHGDYNPKNLLVERAAGGWRVSGVLDWEFAFSGSPLADVGNLLRLVGAYPPRFGEGVRDGLAAAGMPLPDDWRLVARLLDTVALADLLARAEPGGPIHGQVRALVVGRLAAGGL